MSLKKSRAAHEKQRDENGRFVKGKSGNPKGRPRTPKLTDLPKDFNDKAGSDAKKALEALLESTNSRYEAAKIAKDLLPYQYPRLANIESKTQEKRTIEIKWLEAPNEEILTIEGEIVDGEED